MGIGSNFGGGPVFLVRTHTDPDGAPWAPLGAHEGPFPFFPIFQVWALAPFPGTFCGGPCEQPGPLEQNRHGYMAMSLLVPSSRLCTPCPPRKLLGWGPAWSWSEGLTRKNGKTGKIEIGLGGRFWYPRLSVTIQIGPYGPGDTPRIKREFRGEFRKCRISDGN